jgi:hypothetical protein
MPDAFRNRVGREALARAIGAALAFLAPDRIVPGGRGDQLPAMTTIEF